MLLPKFFYMISFYAFFRKSMLLLTVLLTGLVMAASGQESLYHNKDSAAAQIDSAKWFRNYPLQARDTTGYFPNSELYLHNSGAVSGVGMKDTRELPYNSINQMLIGRATGVDVRIPTSEPGKRSSVFIRGTSSLLLQNSDLFYAQPTYVVDGIPLILDHPFAYDVETFGVNRLGTEMDLLSFLNVNDIESIEVLKDFDASAKYGPLAANGVISITTKGPRTGKMRVSVNSWIGLSLRPRVDAINGTWERNFRMPFYEKYANADQWRSFPAYLADSTQSRYFGPANWDDIFYRNGLGDGIQADVSGGSRLANFRFSIGQQSQQGVADRTGMQRYGLNFGINIMPVPNLLITTYAFGAAEIRHPNNFIRDRIDNEDYILNLENPPSPNKTYLQQYYDYLSQGIDKNRNNSARILANAQYSFAQHFSLNSRFGIDYGQNFKSLFIPTTVADGNNFVSDFDGLNKSLVLDNSLRYENTFAEKHHFDFTVGEYDQWEKWRYDYGKAYKGNSDYIKTYTPGDATHNSGNTYNFRLTANYKDFTGSNLASFYGNIGYDYLGKYFFSLYLREDGSSNVPAANRWLFSPTLSAAWNITKEDFMQNSLPWVSNLKLRASWGRVGRLLMDEFYKGGPVYNVDAGWDGNPNPSTYNGFPELNAAFGLGYISPNIQWPYVEQTNIGVDFGLFHDRLKATVDAYSKVDHNLLLKVPTQEEQGYTGIVENGMDVQNYGVEFSVNADVVRQHDFSWSAGLSIYTNQNKLLKLPGGLTDITMGNRRFLVGKPIDRYWVLINQGIYNSDAEIPVNPATGQRMSYQGIPLRAGDPKWKDLSGDYVIDDKDRVMRGRLSPAEAGGFTNTLRYKSLELTFLFNYAFGRKVIDQTLADRFDFANREGVDALSGVKEVNFWQILPGNYQSIPRYNPWSDVNPYQANQTLFLYDASYVKLRSVTLTYDFHGKKLEKAGINMLRVYATGNNLLTLTRYPGGDPEAIDYFGYDQGYYNWAFPVSFTLGFNLQF